MSSTNDSSQAHRTDTSAIGALLPTQDPTDEPSYGQSATGDSQTEPIALDPAVSNTETRPDTHTEYPTPAAQHGVATGPVSTTQPAEVENNLTGLQAPSQSEDHNAPDGNDAGLYPNGQTADEQNLEVDVCRALCSSVSATLG